MWDGAGFLLQRKKSARQMESGTRPFAKCAKERGTHDVNCAEEIKGLGHPPTSHNAVYG